jgi:hypothetical protein
MDYSPKNLNRFKWPITASRKIETSPQNVWLAISRPGNLEDCHPFCEKNPVDQWPGVGARDTIHYYSGWVLDREFTNWIDGVGYDLTIGREGGRKSYVSWQITAEQENVSTLSITIYPHIFQNIPTVIRWMPHIVAIKPFLHSYLESVVKGFDWFITTGKSVQMNQFGTHKWFSI